MFGPVRGLIRGTIAWIGGYLLTLAVVVGGLVEAPDGTARTFLEAHTVVFGAGADPRALVGIPLVVLGLLGYRIGDGIGAGVVGRLRASLGSLMGSGSNRTRAALVGVGYLAVGYALTTVLASVIVGATVGETALAGLVVAVLAGIPGALFGVR